jgi:hypothetical protein
MWMDDERWSGLHGGYGGRYDPRPALKAIGDGHVEAAWDERWENLHHQGNVGVASYAAVPEIARIIARLPFAGWRAYGLLAVIEEARLAPLRANPAIPSWLEEDYQTAWRAVVETALRRYPIASDWDDVQSILAALAFAKGQTPLGSMALLTESDRQEMLDDLVGSPRDESARVLPRPMVREP